MGIGSYFVLVINDRGNNYSMIEFINSLYWFEIMTIALGGLLILIFTIK